jgi:hypothetical protein
MNIAVRTLIRAGAEAGMVEEFQALAEATSPAGAPRYMARPVLEDLARFLVRGLGGPNRDAAFYELCHLVNAVDAAESGRDRRNAFFLGPEQASPGRFRARLERALAKAGWRRPGFARTEAGIAIHYADGDFNIRYGRMPFLAALYEFLCGLDGFAFFPELQAILDDMTQRPVDIRAIQTASNRIASHFRQYRRRHLAQTQQEGKFDVILGFLIERAPAGTLMIDDGAILDFWAQKSDAGDFRAYRTVFDAFVHFVKAMEEAGRAEAMSRAVPIGLNHENGEVEPDDSAASTDAIDEWVSPLTLLDREPAAGIKFFKKEGERKPLEVLMHYGPMAVKLPLAFLRLESFGPVQSAITTDLQVGRGRERVAARVACGDAAPYPAVVAQLEHLLDLVRRLQKAAFYALHKGSEGLTKPRDNVVPLRAAEPTLLFEQARANIEQGKELPDAAAIDQMAAEAAKTFRAIARKGFEEEGLSDDRRMEGFRLGAQALIGAGAQIENYLAAAARIARGEKNLAGWFDADRRCFSERFGILYGVR